MTLQSTINIVSPRSNEEILTAQTIMIDRVTEQSSLLAQIDYSRGQWDASRTEQERHEDNLEPPETATVLQARSTKTG